MKRALHPLLAALLLPPVLLWPLPRVFGSALLTSPLAEGPAHLWGWWVALREGSPLVVHTELLHFPEGTTVLLVDPLHLVPFALGSLWSPSAGFDAVLWFGLFVGGLAGFLLAREAGADRAGQWLGACAGVAVPTSLAIGVDGITEGLGVGWVGVQLALLLGLRRDAPWHRVALLALAIAAGTWAGTYNAVWMALVDLPVGVWLLTRTRRHLLAAVGGLLLAAPYLSAALAVQAGQPGAADRSAPEPPSPMEHWRGAWREGADLLDLLVPAPLTGLPFEVPTTAYLGLVLVALAIAGLVRDRRRWPWMVGAVGFAALALGPWITLHGDVLRVGGRALQGPAGLLELTPLGRLSRWYRAGAVAVLLLVPLAANALRGRWALLAAVLVVLDARWLSPLPAVMPTLPFPHSPALESLDGPVVELPPDHPLFRAGQVADENLLLQVSHGLPTNGTFYNTPGKATVHPALGALRRVVSGESPPAAAGAARDLSAMGYRYLAVYPGRVDTRGLTHLERSLGPPVGSDEHVVVFRLP